MKKYLYDKLQSKIATIIRKNIEFEYTDTYESNSFPGLSTYHGVYRPSREDAMLTAEKILTELKIKKE